MKIDDHFKRSDLLNLATAMGRELANSPWMRINPDGWTAQFDGVINLSHDGHLTHQNARCTFLIPHDWANVLPAVCCTESWVKRGDPDWHVSKEGILCFVLDQQWRDVVGKVLAEQGTKLTAEFATAWCLHNVRWLLFRHHYAYANNIEKWPKIWPAWKHGKLGLKEYLDEKQRGQNQHHGKRI